MNQLKAMAAFVSICEKGGFSAAAKASGHSKSGLSKLVGDLEAHLGCRLLSRTTRQQSLTEEGRRYLDHARQVLDEISQVEARLADQQIEPRGHIRVNAPVSFGERYISPLAARFLKAHPRISLELSLTDDYVDIVREGFDMAIRIGQGPHPSLIQKKLGQIRNGIYATPDYLAGQGKPKKPADIKDQDHKCLVFGHGGWMRPWYLGGKRFTPTPTLLSNNGDLLCRAAIDGLGLVSMPDMFLAHNPNSEKLVCVEAEPDKLNSPIMAVYPAREHLLLKTRSFIDFLSGNLAAEMAA